MNAKTAFEKEDNQDQAIFFPASGAPHDIVDLLDFDHQVALGRRPGINTAHSLPRGIKALVYELTQRIKKQYTHGHWALAPRDCPCQSS
jgi:hypothetical protein